MVKEITKSLIKSTLLATLSFTALTTAQASGAGTAPSTPAIPYTPVSPPFMKEVQTINDVELEAAVLTRREVVNTDTPTVIQTDTANSWTSYFLRSDGSLWGCGLAIKGKLGIKNLYKRSTPVIIEPDSVVDVASGGSHFAYVKTDGSLWASGSNNFGQLGLDDTTNTEILETPQMIVENGVVDVECGSFNTFFLKEDSSLWAMGHNSVGQLGAGTSKDNYKTPVKIVDHGVISVSVGADESTFFITTDGSLWGMGRNDQGNIAGISSGNLFTTPVKIFNAETRQFIMLNNYDHNLPKPYTYIKHDNEWPNKIVAVSASQNHTLFLDDNGTMWGMGIYSSGKMILDPVAMNKANQDLPFIIALQKSVKTIEASYYATHFIKNDNTLWSMGRNQNGLFGNDQLIINTNYYVPEFIAENVTAISASSNRSSYITEDGSVYTVGQNKYGQLGDGTYYDKTAPVEVIFE